MHKNKIWFIFLSLLFFAIILYTIYGVSKFLDYASFVGKTKPNKIELFPENDFFGRYSIKGKYSFIFENKVYSGEDIIDSNFQNSYAVEKAKDQYINQIVVWFNPENPTHSALHKKFPLKEGIYLLILWGIGIYFIWLGFRVSKLMR